MQHVEASPHGLDTGTHPLKRKGLPCRKQLDPVVAQVETQVCRQELGLAPGGNCDNEGTPSSLFCEGSQNDRPRRFRNRQRSVLSTKNRCEGRLIYQEGRQTRQELFAHRVTNGY